MSDRSLPALRKGPDGENGVGSCHRVLPKAENYEILTFSREKYIRFIAFRYHKMCIRECVMGKNEEAMLNNVSSQALQTGAAVAARHCY